MREFVQNNLPSLFICSISVGSVPVSLLYDRTRSSLIWESPRTCKVRYFGQLTLYRFKWYIHNKDIQIIIQNTKSITELRKCVNNNLLSPFRFTISVGSVPVSLLLYSSRYPLIWESHKTCKWWYIFIS